VRCSVRVRTTAGATPSNEIFSSDYQAGLIVSKKLSCETMKKQNDDFFFKFIDCTTKNWNLLIVLSDILQPEAYEYHINEGQTISIPFRITYPVGCISTSFENSSCITTVYMVTPKYQPTSDTCETVHTNDPILFDQNQCGITISSGTWRELKSLNVSGNVDNLINLADRDIFIRLGISGDSGDYSEAWDNVTIPDIKVCI
jgi:hypothetical protein